MENVFRKWDRVYHFVYGWGNIVNDEFPLEVEFDSRKSTYRDMFKDGYLLSFTEYRLEGFSQERPEELPKKGDLVWVRNEFPSEWEIGYFFKKEGNTYFVSASKNLQGWRSAGLEIRTTNPYKDEKI